MKTKFDVGEKVLVEAEVFRIKINEKGVINYTLKCPNWTNLESFLEEDLISKRRLGYSDQLKEKQDE